MMKKLFFKLILLSSLFMVDVSAQVTATLSNLKVNNVGATVINFSSNPTVSVSFKVNLTTLNGDFNNVMGNMYVYTKMTAQDSPIQHGFSAVTFVVNYPPFVPQTTYTGEFYFTVTLSANQFNASGGTLYAEYKNNNNQMYKTSDIAIIKKNLLTLPIQICCPQTVAEGGIPEFIVTHGNSSGRSVPSGYLVERQLVGQNDWEIVNHSNDNLPLNASANYRWRNNESTLISNTVLVNVLPIDQNDIQYSQDLQDGAIPVPLVGGRARIKTGEEPGRHGTVNSVYEFITQYQWQTISASDYQYGGGWTDIQDAVNETYSPPMSSTSYADKQYFRRLAIYGNDRVSSNMVYIHKLNQAEFNTICCNQTLTNNGQPVVISGSPYTGGDIVWEMATDQTLQNWASFGDYNSVNYVLPTPSRVNVPNTYKVRRVVYDHAYTRYYSNIVTVIINPASDIPPDPVIPPIINELNNICCDQSVIAYATPAPLIGNIPTSVSGAYSFVWQSQSRSGAWINIVGATSKDYSPPPQGSGIVSYRRVLYMQGVANYSNPIKVSVAGRVSAKQKPIEVNETNKDDEEITDNFSTSLYPNPCSTSLNIQTNYNTLGFILKIYDVSGRLIHSGIFENNYLNTIRTGDLESGYYTLIIEKENVKVVKRFIKK
jgi:hypothetical protein